MYNRKFEEHIKNEHSFTKLRFLNLHSPPRNELNLLVQIVIAYLGYKMKTAAKDGMDLMNEDDK